jgi:hypothetical protein
MCDFAVKSDADRLPIFLTFSAQKCLKFFAKKKWNELFCQNDPFYPAGDGDFILAAFTNELKSFRPPFEDRFWKSQGS